jgi:hypothetical protein
MTKKAKPIPQAEWEWFGTPGHFICAQWCRFHLTTVVGNYIISTVGEYVHPRHSGGVEAQESKWLAKNWPGEDIGAGRKYETMVFKAGRCTATSCGCQLPEISGTELDMKGYNTRVDATRGHIELCTTWARKDIE